MNINAKSVGVVLACLISATLVNIWVWSVWNHSFISNDGAQYLSTAQNWLDGNGLSTDALIFAPHFQGVLPAPQTVWPPGYIYVVGLTSMLGLPLESTAFLVNLISQAISAVLMLLILRRFGLSFIFALCSAMVFYLTAIPWSYSFAIVTEPLFSVFMLAAILSQPSDIRGKIWPWIISGIFIALALFTRYSGVFFVAGVGIGMFAYLIKISLSRPGYFIRGFSLLTLQLSIPVLVYAAVLYRTYSLTGTASRNIDAVATDSGALVIKKMVWNIREFLGLTYEGILPFILIKVLFMVLAILFAVIIFQILLTALLARRNVVVSTPDNASVMWYVIVGHSAVFFAFFAIGAIGYPLVDLTHRYLYQLYLGAFVLFCILIARTYQKLALMERTGFKSIFRGSVAAIVCVFALAQFNFATGYVKGSITYSNPSLYVSQALALKVSTDVNVQEKIHSCFYGSNSSKSEPAGTLWTTNGQLIYLATGVSTITVPNMDVSADYSMDIIQEHIDTYGIKMFVILNNLVDMPEDYPQMLSNVKEWLIRQGHTKVPMLEDTIEDGITVDLYVIDKTCLN